VTRRSAAWLALQAIVTVTLLVFLARRLDVAAMQALLARIPLSFYLISLGAVLAGQVAYAWRWRLLLTAAGVSVPFTNVLRQYFVGIFVNNFLPSTVGGDVAKVYYLGQVHGFRTVGASIAIDRILGVGLMAVLATAALWLSPVSAPRLTAALVACAGITVVAATLLILTGHGTGGRAARVRPLGERAVKLAEVLQRLRLDMAAPLRRPAVIAQAAVVVIGYALAMTVVYLRFAALQNAPVAPFVAMLAVVTATIVLSNVPIALNGLGLREQLHASLLAPLAISPEIAVAISLLLYAHLLVGSLIGLAFWLRAR
jgi:uncharacterized protein (TIRG00374 family)